MSKDRNGLQWDYRSHSALRPRPFDPSTGSGTTGRESGEITAASRRWLALVPLRQDSVCAGMTGEMWLHLTIVGAKNLSPLRSTGANSGGRSLSLRYLELVERSKGRTMSKDRNELRWDGLLLSVCPRPRPFDPSTGSGHRRLKDLPRLPPKFVELVETSKRTPMGLPLSLCPASGRYRLERRRGDRPAAPPNGNYILEDPTRSSFLRKRESR